MGMYIHLSALIHVYNTTSIKRPISVFDSFFSPVTPLGRCSHFAFVSACQVKGRGKPSKGMQQQQRSIKSSHDIIQQDIRHIETLLLLEMVHRAVLLLYMQSLPAASFNNPRWDLCDGAAAEGKVF